MPSPLPIKHLTRLQIDPVRWNECIELADNGSPYARTDYLDILSPHWEALIRGDYEQVMPLPIRKKFGIRYLYQPALVPQLGVFGKSLNKEEILIFLKAIPSDIKWIDATLNPSSCLEHPDFPLQRRTNFILPLSDAYATLRSRYRENHRRNLQRAEKAGCTIDRATGVHEILTLALAHAHSSPKIAPAVQESFLRLMENWIPMGRAQTYGVRVNDELLAGAVFLVHRNRACYLLAGNHPNGKTLGASHALIDAFIEANAGTSTVLDFEGSDLPSLAFFYEGFGSFSESYGWLQLNRLPRWWRWIKS